jgi:hypothetical protein
MRKQKILLEHYADRPPLRRNMDTLRGVFKCLPVEDYTPIGKRDEPRQHTQEGGLPGPVRAEHRHHVSRFNVEVDAQMESA